MFVLDLSAYFRTQLQHLFVQICLDIACHSLSFTSQSVHLWLSLVCFWGMVTLHHAHRSRVTRSSHHPMPASPARNSRVIVIVFVMRATRGINAHAPQTHRNGYRPLCCISLQDYVRLLSLGFGISTTRISSNQSANKNLRQNE